MKQLYVLAAAAALTLAVPTMGSAQDLNVRIGGDHVARHAPAARVVVHEDRGYHRGWRHARAQRVVIVKRSHRHWH